MVNQTPEQKERDQIDALLRHAGWVVQDNKKAGVYCQTNPKQRFEDKFTVQWRKENKAAKWALKPLGDLVSLINWCSKSRTKHSSDHCDIFMRTQHTNNDKLELDNTAYVSLPDRSEAERTQIEDGGVLVRKTGVDSTTTDHIERNIGSAYVNRKISFFRSQNEVGTQLRYRN